MDLTDLLVGLMDLTRFRDLMSHTELKKLIGQIDPADINGLMGPYGPYESYGPFALNVANCKHQCQRKTVNYNWI